MNHTVENNLPPTPFQLWCTSKLARPRIAFQSERDSLPRLLLNAQLIPYFAPHAATTTQKQTVSANWQRFCLQRAKTHSRNHIGHSRSTGSNRAKISWYMACVARTRWQFQNWSWGSSLCACTVYLNADWKFFAITYSNFSFCKHSLGADSWPNVVSVMHFSVFSNLRVAHHRVYGHTPHVYTPPLLLLPYGRTAALLRQICAPTTFSSQIFDYQNAWKVGLVVKFEY